jgi:hypothetical protein
MPNMRIVCQTSCKIGNGSSRRNAKARWQDCRISGIVIILRMIATITTLVERHERDATPIIGLSARMTRGFSRLWLGAAVPNAVLGLARQ